jgi:Lon protease-like protein
MANGYIPLMPSRLPLFPLNLVLFPGEPLPLHIFEPRYRQLLADCLDGDQRFGITAATKPEPGSLGCIARVRMTQPLPDGRSNIVVLGERRFAVRALLEEDAPYLIASIEEFDDQPGSAPLPQERAELRELAETYRGALHTLADSPGEEADWAEESESFTFQIAALADLPVDTKGTLLGMRSTRDRARALLELLPPLIHLVRDRVEVHVRARSNGTGGHGHDVVTGL